MALGFVFSTRTSASPFLSPSTPRKLSKWRIPFTSPYRHSPHSIRFTRSFCKCSCKQVQQEAIDMSEYKEKFSRRMALAGLKPHHRIALGVSGGPDSIALCVLTAAWKRSCINGAVNSGGFIDGLLAVIVDHGLRADSKEEAISVSHRVSKMGIRCEISHCDWSDGRPKQGQLQEAAREMRYQTLQDICSQNQIGVLLIAHHADDQAELLILRLSRNSGVLGLAGMPLTSEIFSTHIRTYDEVSKSHGILVVRPLLEFSKEDMYKICKMGSQEWVEDPTNQSPLFARNRIRMSLNKTSSRIVKSEIQALISTFRKTRLYVDEVCNNLINQTVAIMDEGYAVIDLELLNPSKLNDICLTKFISSVLKFVSQRNRPIRGSTSKLLLDYIRTFPCKSSLTAAGCYLCPAPGSKGSKVLVCYSAQCALPPGMQFFHILPLGGQNYGFLDELQDIILDGKSQLTRHIPDPSEIPFLHTSSESILSEAKRLKILGDLTYGEIFSLQCKELDLFKAKTEVDYEPKDIVASSRPLLQPGLICYFMNRFIVTWNLIRDASSVLSEESTFPRNAGEEYRQCYCRCGCLVGNEMVAEVRHMVESDWLYVAKLAKDSTFGTDEFPTTTVKTMDIPKSCLDYMKLSAQKAILSLKSIPLAGRRGLPVLVNSEGLLLSIPSIGFSHCCCLVASATFKPRVPLGGGHSSFI